MSVKSRIDSVRSGKFRSLNVRLTVIFTITSAVFTVVMFAASYRLLTDTLKQDENARLHRIALRFWALYQTHGLALLEEERFRSEFLGEGETFVRVADPEIGTLLLYYPESLGVFRFDELERIDPEDPETDILLVTDDGLRTLRVITLTLPDGTLLSIGIEVTQRFLMLDRFGLFFPLAAVPFLILSVLGGLFYSRNALKPIGGLIRTTRTILETGRFESRVPAPGSDDELDELVTLFNRMISSIERLVGGMRGALDNVAHDLRTPLARLSGRVELALRRHEQRPAGSSESEEHADDASAGRGASGQNSGPLALQEAVETLRDCAAEAERIRTMLSALMDISEAETGQMRLERTATNVSALLDDMAELYGYAAEEKGLSLRTEIEPGLTAPIDEPRFRQVVANLFDNAVKYTPEGGTITLRASVHDDPGASSPMLAIEMEDTGIGIAEADLPFIWDRLYRCDRSRSESGLGLGLSIVKAVVEAHGGTVLVTSEPGTGSRFSLHLPTDITKV